MLNSIADQLGLDAENFRAMRDKALPVSMHEAVGSESEEDLDHLLGISPSMGAEEKRSHLSKEYRKWNARTNSSDPKVKGQARMMIKHIAEYRKRLRG
jgi:hypothetical protein